MRVWAGTPTDYTYTMRTLDQMMVALAIESARDASTIKDTYRDHLELLVLDKYSAVETALYNGGLARVPEDPLRFNLLPRVTGPSPIGEKDLVNQSNYIAARPAALGALLSIASQIRSGPIEITSLVRHSEYQGALKETNKNATTTVPMHTMGLAFDIALVNTPLSRVYEIRDVLRRMRDAGEILFIGERQQLVFHVVPHPSRLGYFTDVYASVIGLPLDDLGTRLSVLPSIPETPALVASVTAEIIAVLPSKDFAAEWWAADEARADLAVDVLPAGVQARRPAASRSGDLALGATAALGIVLSSVLALRRRPNDQEFTGLLKTRDSVA